MLGEIPQYNFNPFSVYSENGPPGLQITEFSIMLAAFEGLNLPSIYNGLKQGKLSLKEIDNYWSQYILSRKPHYKQEILTYMVHPQIMDSLLRTYTQRELVGFVSQDNNFLILDMAASRFNFPYEEMYVAVGTYHFHAKALTQHYQGRYPGIKINGI